jgi:phosphatidylglycerophosphate synthase
MLEGGATLRAARGLRTELAAQAGPLAGLAGQLLLLAILAQTVGLGSAGWLIGGACALILDGALARSLWRSPRESLSPATWVTLARASLTVGVAALTAASFEQNAAVGTLVALASSAIALDWVDGWVARRTGTESALGARLDGEVDAFLILALSVDVAPSLGAWVLAIGLARYAFLAAGWRLDWMRAQLPHRDWRKIVTAAQGFALVLAAAEIVPAMVSRALLGVALALLAESFGRDVWWLWRHRRTARERVALVRRRHPVVAAALTALALLIVWAALVTPSRPWLLTPAQFVRIPLEGLVLVMLALALPAGARRLMAWMIGPALGLLVLVKLLDLGFFIAFGRPFNPVDDWSYGSAAVALVRDTYGSRDADLAIAGAALLAAVALLLPTLALTRLTRVAAQHRRPALRAVAALGVVWVLCWAFGAGLSGTSIASTSATRLAVDEVHAVQADLRDQARFRALLARKDPYGKTPASRLLAGLRGKDVLLVFVESYGKLAVQGTLFSPDIDRLLGASQQQLAAAGFSARSGWLTSSTYGGGSWLAHSTLQSGVWVNDPDRYSELIASRRLTLTGAFGRAGWRTVADVPATHGAWPEGHSFYHFDAIYDRENLGYNGPKYGFSPMPDQYALQALQKLELAKHHRRPVFSEIDLTSSHEPWTRIPPLIGWNRLGKGSVFDHLPIDTTGATNTQKGYARSIEYALRSLFSFVEHYHDKNLVLIMLGDHQPSRVVEFPGRPPHDVPISIVAHDPRVLQRIAGWDWTDGLLPDAAAPEWPMSAFRNRFLDAFDPS